MSRGEIAYRIPYNHIWVKPWVFCLCNLLARVYNVRLFCFGGSVFGHKSAWVCASTIKCYFLASVSRVSVRVFHYISGGSLLGLQRHCFFTSFVAGVCPLDHQEKRSHQVPMDSLIQRRISSSWQVGVRDSRCTTEPGEAQEPAGEYCQSDW
jgi:hypothetical protein